MVAGSGYQPAGGDLIMQSARLVLSVCLFAAESLTAPAARAATPRQGGIHVRALDADSRQPIDAASVRVVEAALSATTGSDGGVVFGNLATGSYTLEVGHAGYRPQLHADVIVRSDEQTSVVIELSAEDLRTGLHLSESVTVRPTYFPEADEQPLGLTSFSNEAVRRAAASADDVSRFVSGLPSVAKVNDSDNSLIVRGGSPMENGFFLEMIEDLMDVGDSGHL
jgi:hypothetical protein